MKNGMKAALKRVGLLNTAYGIRDNLQEIRFVPANIAYWLRHQEQLPIPPLRLITLVSGTPDIEWFLSGGKLAVQSIVEIVKKNRLDVGLFSNILDFGCGCGRVIRHWEPSNFMQLFGVDYNDKLIEWCQQNIPFARFSPNNLTPPLNFDSAQFDLIYALSVFTHLPEDVQLLWIKEMARILRTGGYLILSTHGDRYLDQLDAKEKASFAEGELVVRVSEIQGSNSYGAYHPEQYIRKIFGSDFEIMDRIKEGAKGNPYQDLYLMRKR